MIEQSVEEAVEEEIKRIHERDKLQIEDKKFVVKRTGKNLILKLVGIDRPYVDRSPMGMIFAGKKEEPVKYNAWKIKDQFSIDDQVFELRKVKKNDFWFRRVV